jgi:hypothetical protein
VQQTRLAKQKQLRRGCVLSRLRSDFTMPEAGQRVQSKISIQMISARTAFSIQHLAFSQGLRVSLILLSAKC